MTADLKATARGPNTSFSTPMAPSETALDAPYAESIAPLSSTVPVQSIGPSPAPAVLPARDHDLVPHSNTRRVIARRLTAAKSTIPHFYLTIDCEVDPLLALREQAHQSLQDGRLSLNDFVVKAAAVALAKVPAINASWTDDAIRLWHDIDIAVAVSTPAGLITPIVRRADRKSVTSISLELKELTRRARQGRLRPDEYQGGSFTVSNLGMHGIREFSAIINPPQCCILAVGAAEQRPTVRNGAMVIATLMTCTLSCDHRVVDGVVAAEFLATFRTLIESPTNMV